MACLDLIPGTIREKRGEKVGKGEVISPLLPRMALPSSLGCLQPAEGVSPGIRG